MFDRRCGLTRDGFGYGEMAFVKREAGARRNERDRSAHVVRNQQRHGENRVRRLEDAWNDDALGIDPTLVFRVQEIRNQERFLRFIDARRNALRQDRNSPGLLERARLDRRIAVREPGALELTIFVEQREDDAV